MVDLKRSDIKIIDEAFQTGGPGYALNFSDKTFAALAKIFLQGARRRPRS